MTDIEQMKKIIPLITREVPFGQDVYELVFGINVTDLDFEVQKTRKLLFHKAQCVMPRCDGECAHDAVTENVNTERPCFRNVFPCAT